MLIGWLGMCGASALAAAGVAGAPAKPGDEPAKARLVAEQSGVVPGGETWIGLAFEIDPGWHIYWPGQNDSGAPVNFSWRLPSGWTIGQVVWPAPARHVEGDALDHVLEGKVLILASVRAPKEAKAGEAVKIEGDFDWMVCKTACKVGKTSASVSMRVLGADETAAATKDAGLFAEGRKRVPVDGSSVKRSWSGDSLMLTVEGASGLSFFPSDESAEVKGLIGSGVAKGPSITLGIGRDESGKRRQVSGVLEARSKDKKTEWYWINAPLPAQAK